MERPGLVRVSKGRVAAADDEIELVPEDVVPTREQGVQAEDEQTKGEGDAVAPPACPCVRVIRCLQSTLPSWAPTAPLSPPTFKRRIVGAFRVGLSAVEANSTRVSELRGVNDEGHCTLSRAAGGSGSRPAVLCLLHPRHLLMSLKV